jgi:hypothetical protein
MRILYGAIGCWAVVSGAGLWEYVYRYALPAAPATRVERVELGTVLHREDGSDLTLGAGCPVTLLDFTSSDCGCSQFLKGYISKLEAAYSPKGVRFVHIVESADQVDPHGARVMDSHGVVARRFGVGATPAAVIVDTSGVIVFAGSYNRARFCDDADSAFAEHALEAVVAGKKPVLPRTPFYGCAVPR